MSQKSEAAQARKAAIIAIEALFGADASANDAQRLQSIHNGLEPFSFPEPMPNGRTRHGKPIDFLAASFWHAGCAILYRWLIEKYAVTSPMHLIRVYRGQANTWPLQPSLWRTSYAGLADRSIDAVREFLVRSGMGAKNPFADFFPDFLSLRGVRAFAQHHEFPTSLIDFSFNPLVALYFASRNSAQTSKNDVVKGLGVIYECAFQNFSILEQRTGVRPELVMLPPSHVFRIYQQRGFFLDCGPVPDERISREIELPCEKIYFPREYPAMKGIDDVFSDVKVVSYIPKNSSYFKSGVSDDLERNWYMAFEYYTKAMDGLKDYCKGHAVNFSKDEAVEAMLKASSLCRSPMGMLDIFGSAKPMQDMILAESFSNAAHAIFDITAATGRSGRVMNWPLVVAYATTNPAFFQALFEMAKRVLVFELPLFAGAFQEVTGIGEQVDGSLSAEQLEELRNITEMTYGPAG